MAEENTSNPALVRAILAPSSSAPIEAASAEAAPAVEEAEEGEEVEGAEGEEEGDDGEEGDEEEGEEGDEEEGDEEEGEEGDDEEGEEEEAADPSPSIVFLNRTVVEEWPDLKFAVLPHSAMTLSVDIGDHSYVLETPLPADLLSSANTETITKIHHIFVHAPDKDPSMPYGFVRIFAKVMKSPSPIFSNRFLIIDEPLRTDTRMKRKVSILTSEDYYRAMILTSQNSLVAASHILNMSDQPEKFVAFARKLGVPLDFNRPQTQAG